MRHTESVFMVETPGRGCSDQPLTPANVSDLWKKIRHFAQEAEF